MKKLIDSSVDHDDSISKAILLMIEALKGLGYESGIKSFIEFAIGEKESD